MRYIEQIYPFLILNSILLGYMIFKKESKIVKFSGCLGFTMYSYLCTGFYGEEIIFH